jgi:hypothetical protein
LKGNDNLAKPNYQFEKRQRELAKKAKKAEKAARKSNGESSADDEPDEQTVADSVPAGVAAEPGPDASSSDSAQVLPKP